MPVGYKRLTAEAKDVNNRALASGTGETYLQEAQRSSVTIEMTAITARTVQLHVSRSGQPSLPELVAFQDGDGAWQAVQGGNGEYRMEVAAPNGRYGLAVVYKNGCGVDVTILHATVAELLEVYLDAGMPPLGNPVTVSGTVSDSLRAPKRVSLCVMQRHGYTRHGAASTWCRWSLEPMTRCLFVHRNVGLSGRTDIPPAWAEHRRRHNP